MKKSITFISSAFLLSALLLSGCKGKVEEAEKKTPEVKSEKAVKPEGEKVVGMGSHTADDIRRWIEKIAKDADPEDLKKAEKMADKFSAAEIIAGLAVRPKPEYWDTVSEQDKLKTVSILNTKLSQVRIDAGLADEPGALNSNLYLEADEGKIIAASTLEEGSQLF